jgi:hypothetical protein
MNHTYFFIGVLVLLIGAAFFIPTNGLTGNVVKESCGKLGCSELCDSNGPNTCSSGMVCCPTNWNTGVCDYESSCTKIQEYSIFQSLETYQDSVRTAPDAVHADWHSFFLPLALVIIACLVLLRSHGPRKV